MQLLKKFVPGFLKKNLKDKLGVPSLSWSLQNLKRCNFTPHFAIDGGAYVGEWTKDFLEVFPGCKVLMIEAQPGKEVQLQSVCSENKNVQYAISLLGARDEQEIFFIENETISYATDNLNKQGKPVKTVTLDTLVQKFGDEWPDFLKLDVQGFELEVLKGATQCLKRLEVCLLEVSVFDWNDREVPMISDVLSFMDQHGFIVYDITQITRRPLDKALNQVDFLFVKKNSKLTADKRWSS